MTACTRFSSRLVLLVLCAVAVAIAAIAAVAALTVTAFIARVAAITVTVGIAAVAALTVTAFIALVAALTVTVAIDGAITVAVVVAVANTNFFSSPPSRRRLAPLLPRLDRQDPGVNGRRRGEEERACGTGVGREGVYRVCGCCSKLYRADRKPAP